MIASLNAIKRRMKSIEATRKTTRAMEMVSAAKLNRTRSLLHSSRQYFTRLEYILHDLLRNTEGISHPLLEKRENDGKVVLCVIASDAGLCSTYNEVILKASENFLAKFPKNKATLITVGKEAGNYFRKHGIKIVKSYAELHGRYSRKVSEEIGKDLVDIFLRKETDELYVAYTHFDSTLHYKPAIEKVLNIDFEVNSRFKYIIEPDISGVVNELVPLYVMEKLNLLILDAFTSEHSARMVAMKTATDNADDLLDQLTLMRNKARQAAITKEVLEISAVAEAVRE